MKLNKLIELFFLVGFFFSMSSCSIMPWSEKKNPVLNFLTAKELNYWSLIAKFSLTNEKETITGALQWDRKGGGDKIEFMSPTGMIVGTLISKNDNFVLRLKKETRTSNRLEDLFDDNLPWPVSIKSMGYWIRGLPDPELITYDMKFGKNGRIEQMRQDGWTIIFSGKILLEQGTNRFELPKRLSLKKNQFILRWTSTEWQENQE